MNLKGIKYIVVGSGFYGATFAREIAEVLDEKVIVLEKREHTGGNSFSFVDKVTNIEVHKYGSHIFHTKNMKVWKYINKFTSFNNYRHKVLAEYKNKIYSMPINLFTINSFFNKNLRPFEVKDFLLKEIKKENIKNPTNLEDMAISLVGKSLYEAFVKGYTIKQWEKDPLDLPASIITRLPVRDHYNGAYFDDPNQGIPLDGYGKVFERMFDHENIELKLDTDYFEVENLIDKSATVIFSGPIDSFFRYIYGELSWRTLQFDQEIKEVKDFQGTAVLNYADIENSYTRTHEFKHYHTERGYLDQKKTILFHEKSKTAQKGELPYYPINTEDNQKRLKLYQKDLIKKERTILGGRLGSYQYLDMDQVIEMALKDFQKLRKDSGR